jgi:hypothetical protein
MRVRTYDRSGAWGRVGVGGGADAGAGFTRAVILAVILSQGRRRRRD